MLFAGYRPTTGNFPSELLAVTAARTGWRTFAESRLVASTGPDQTGFLAALWGGRTVGQRWRGAAAQGAGTGFRNRHWTSAGGASKHIPISFKPASANVSVAPGVADATWTGFAPTVQTPVAVTPGVGQGTWAGFAPTVLTPVNLTPGTGAGTWTGFAPTVLTPKNVTPGTGAATWTGFAPTVQTPVNVTPGTGQATWTGFAPTVQGGSGLIVRPGVGDATWTGFAPTVAATQNVRVSPGTGLALWDGFAPTVVASGTAAPVERERVIPLWLWEQGTAGGRWRN